MRDEWGDNPDYRQPVPLSEEARRRAARQGLARAREILSGVRSVEPESQVLEVDQP